jgi:hypothetical protein
MRNRLIIGALALVAVLAIVVPAVAQSQQAATPATSFTATGPVKDVIQSAGALRLRVDSGSRGVKPFIGGALVVRVASEARILLVDDGIASLGTLSDVHAGDRVVVSGRIDRSAPSAPVYIAQNIRVLDRTPTAKLARFSAGGTVTGVDAQGAPNTMTFGVDAASRALWDRLGSGLTVVVNSGTKVFFKSDGTTTAISLSQVVVGQKAWVTGVIDRSQAAPVFTAGRITVQAASAPAPAAAPGI